MGPKNHAEYIAKARTTDQQYCGAAPSTTGPAETKLATLGEVKGLVVGAFGEGSEERKTLVEQAGGDWLSDWSSCSSRAPFTRSQP